VGSVPAGLVPDKLVAEIHDAAVRELHPRFAELVGATTDPFVQVIVDVAAPRMAFGRACLLGDAAFVVRPHTAAATAKAAADSTALAEALTSGPGEPEAALRRWEANRLEQGHGLVAHGIALGRRTVGPRGSSAHSLTTLDATAERFSVVAQPSR
jgi:2-polyprenyl-6-methoxyphenol hydroxylase-like FAD-dependent oxidoreductase